MLYEIWRVVITATTFIPLYIAVVDDLRAEIAWRDVLVAGFVVDMHHAHHEIKSHDRAGEVRLVPYGSEGFLLLLAERMRSTALSLVSDEMAVQIVILKNLRGEVVV